MEQAALNITYSYEGAITTTDPVKIGLVLNTILHNPDTALLIEPNKNEYWIFYAGGVTFPTGESDLKHFKIDKEINEDIEIEDDSISGADRWCQKLLKLTNCLCLK